MNSVKRPTGVTILGILAVLAGAFGLFAPLMMFGMGSLNWILGVTNDAQNVKSSGTEMILASIPQFVGAGITLAAGLGTLTLKTWAWVLLVIGQVISLIGYLIGMTQPGAATTGVFGVVLAAAILYYLFRHDVRQAFGRN